MGTFIRLEVDDGISIRSLTPEDAELAFRYVQANRERFRRWLSWVDDVQSVEDERMWIDRSSASDTSHMANGIWLADTVLAGTIGVGVAPFGGSGEIGYTIAAEHEGRGIMTRSTARLIDWAFAALRLHRITIRAATSNHRSRAIPERLGFVEEGVLREEAVSANGDIHDLVVYGLLAREWPGAQKSTK